MKKISKTWLFLILVFLLSHGMAGIAYLSGIRLNTVPALIMSIAFMFMPLISAIIVTRIHRENIAANLMISFRINKWFFVAWLLPIVLVLVSFLLSLLFPNVDYSPEMAGFFKRLEPITTPDKIEEMKNSMEKIPIHPVAMTIISGLVAGITVNAIAAFGEESGWRGFLLKQFHRLSFVQASLATGFIWGLWHAPLIIQGHNYPQHPVFGVFMMIIWCTLATPLFIYIAIKAKSTIAAAIFHGTINAVAGAPLMVLEGGNDLTIGLTGVAGFLSMIILILVFYLYDRFLTKEKAMTKKISEFLESQNHIPSKV